MAGGSNNKKGTSGQGASNQSNKTFVTDGEKRAEVEPQEVDDITGSRPSEPQQMTSDQDANRDHSIKGQEKKHD